MSCGLWGISCHPGTEATSAATPAPARTAGTWPPLDSTFLEAQAATQGYRLGRPVALAATKDGAVLFRRTKARDRRAALYELSAAGEETVLASVETLLGGADEHLSAEESARRERTRTATAGVVDIDVSRDGTLVLVPLSGRLFVVERPSRRVRELSVGEGTPYDPHLSPDGKAVAFVRDGDLWTIATGGGAPRRLTKHPDGLEYGVAEFVAQEEFGRTRGYWFSPDGSRILFQRTDPRRVETVYVADARHPEKTPVPFRYPRPGKANAVVDLGLVKIAGGEPTWVTWDLAKRPYLAQVTWKGRTPPTLVLFDRNQTEEEVVTVDPETGRTKSLLVERDDAWVDLVPGNPAWLDDGSGFLWAKGEEAGYALERHAADGALVGTVLPASFGVRRIAGVTPDDAAVFVQASADPRTEDVYRVPLDGKPPVRLGPEKGLGSVFTENGVAVVTTAAESTGPTVTAYFPNASGVLLKSEVERPPFEPTTVLESVDVGGRSLFTAITRPRAFEPGRKYPVLVRVYGGPGFKMVLDARDRFLLDQWYADAGFVVVRADGRGTPDRGRAFERAILKDFVDAPLDDQILALRAMQAKHPEMDAGKTGIFGWSFGGYLSAMAVLLHPDVFSAAVAGAPPTDWELYDTAYTERYLKQPSENADGYRRSNVLTYAERLSRPLLLMQGITDDNVHFAHTLSFIDALYAAGKRAEVVTLSSTHMVPEPRLAFLREKVQVDFFREHLGPGAR